MGATGRVIKIYQSTAINGLAITALGALLKLSGLRGDVDFTALPADVAVGQCFFRKTKDLYTF